VFGELAEHIGDSHLVCLFVQFGQGNGTQLVVSAAHFSRLKELNEKVLT
jgi:hypothetical protein